MPRTTADPLHVLTAGLRARLPARLGVLAEEDADTPLRGETVIVSAPAGSPLSNASAAFAGSWTVQIVVLARTRTRAADLADDVLTAALSLEQTRVPGAGFVSTVDTTMLPARSPVTAVSNRGAFTQYNMQLTVRVQADVGG